MSPEFIATTIVTLFAIVDPLGNVPFFVALTQGYSDLEKKGVILHTILTFSAILLVFTLFGSAIFSAFGITIPAFRIAGGILLLRVAFSMLHGELPKTKQTERERIETLQRALGGHGAEEKSPDKVAVGVVPLGMPLFAGPGAITTVIVLSSHGLWCLPAIAIAVLTVALLSYPILMYADKLLKKLGRVGILALVRVMGLILAAIAVQFVITGVVEVATEWYRTVVA
ncbi:MAG: hypothetical protein DRN20_04310 [Thermoplasmata archaeon]|nr:MAG: hypothetical protein DRN20_04310 [Thermoplasmata archaeon]